MGKVIFIILFFVLVSCVNGEELDAPELLTPISAQIRFNTAIVTRGLVADIEQRVGIVRVESTGLNFGPVSDFFETFHVRPGERVVEGQLLASLDMRHVRAQILDREERIERLRSDFAFENNIARIDIALAYDPTHLQRELNFALERQNLRLRHEEEDLRILRERYAMSFLYAPFDGVVSYLPARVSGTWVPAFVNVIYITSDDARVFVQYTGPTLFFHGLGSRVIIYIEGEAYDAVRLGLTREQISRYHTPLPLRFLLASDTQPPAGAFAAIHIYTNRAEDVLRLPHNALFFSPDIGFYVHRMIDGQREMTAVQTGVHTETYVEIISGLEEGDEVYARS